MIGLLQGEIDPFVAQTRSAVVQRANRALKVNLPPLLRDMRAVWRKKVSCDRTPQHHRLRSILVEDPKVFFGQLIALEKAWAAQGRAVVEHLEKKFGKDYARPEEAEVLPPVPPHEPAVVPPAPVAPARDEGADRVLTVMERIMAKATGLTGSV